MLTFNNWFQPEFMSGSAEPGYADPWEIKFTHKNCDTGITFPDAINKSLSHIANSHHKLVVQYSGGLDSEIIIREAIKAGIDVIPYTLRFMNDLNKHELYYCNILESELGINIRYIDIDIVKWYTDPDFHRGYCYHISENGMWHPAAPLAWWMREKISELEGDCCVINGSGDTPMTRRPEKLNPRSWHWAVSFDLDGHWKRFNYSKNNFPDDVPLFYLHTPELQYSYLTHELFKHCVQPQSYKLGPTSTRHAIYKQCYPELTPRTKYSGFEKLENLNITQPDVYHRAYSCTMRTQHIPYEEYIRMLRDPTRQRLSDSKAFG